MNAPNPYAPPRAAVSDIADSTGLEPAGRGTRLLATIVDSIIFMVAVYLPLIIFGGGVEVSSQGRVNWGPMFASTGGVVACIGLAVWAWFTYKFVKENGQSIAKKMLGIKVLRTDGSAASVGRIFWLRNVVNGLLNFIPLYGLVDALLIFGEERKTIHDRIADTIVVKA